MPVRGGKPLDRERHLPGEISRLLSLQPNLKTPEWTFTENKDCIKIVLEFTKSRTQGKTRSEKKKERSKRRFLEWKRKRQEKYLQSFRNGTNDICTNDICTNDNIEEMQCDERTEKQEDERSEISEENQEKETESNKNSIEEDSCEEESEIETDESSESESLDSQDSKYSNVNKPSVETAEDIRESSAAEKLESCSNESVNGKEPSKDKECLQEITKGNGLGEAVSLDYSPRARSPGETRAIEESENWTVVGKKKENLLEPLVKELNEFKSRYYWNRQNEAIMINEESLMKTLHFNYKIGCEMIGTLTFTKERTVDMNNLRMCAICTGTGLKACVSSDKHQWAQIVIEDYRATKLYKFCVQKWKEKSEQYRTKKREHTMIQWFNG